MTDTVDVVILTALAVERRAVLDYVGPAKDAGRRGAYRAPIGDYQVVVADMHGMGNVNAAVATQQAIAAWDPLHVILAGIAGGVKEPLERMLGDVVVADQLVYYELAKTAPGGHRVRPEVFRRPCMFRG